MFYNKIYEGAALNSYETSAIDINEAKIRPIIGWVKTFIAASIEIKITCR